jgi:hypothetical protein
MLYFKPSTAVPHGCNFINGPYGAVVQAGGRAEAQPNRLRDKPRAPPIRVYSKSVIGCIRSFACGGY